MNNIAFFESITSYYVDMHNYLHDRLNFKIYYVYENFLNHNSADLSEKLNFSPTYLSPKGKNTFRFKELVSIIRENSPQNVITIEYSLLTLQLILIKRLYRFNYKIIVRTDDSLDMLNNSLTIKHSLAKKIMSPIVDDFILCDKSVYEYYQKKLSKGAYFPILRDEQKMLEELENAKPLGLELITQKQLEKKKIVIFVGRLVPVKNIETIFKAINRIERDDFVLAIIGDGPLRDELECEAEKSSHRIVFTGNLTGVDLLAWYSIAHVLVLPSWKEAFGAVVNEAMIANCFPIISETVGSKGLIEDGKNGYIFNPHREDLLSELIIKALDSTPLIKDNTNLMNMTFADCANNIQQIVAGR